MKFPFFVQFAIMPAFDRQPRSHIPPKPQLRYFDIHFHEITPYYATDFSPAGSSEGSFPPEMISAKLSDTDSLFTLRFSEICYCTTDGYPATSEPAVCGQNYVSREFDHG